MIVAINGPTASGKTEVALALARELAASGVPAEIVNADSMLVYRGMDIGTAKPTPEQRLLVPHHLIDIMEVTETASVAEFQRLARAAIADCQARGVLPLLVGGSALYVRAILDKMDFPGTDPAIRARYEQRLAEIGPEALHAELAVRAPGVAAGILPGNARRTVRALEALDLGGFTSVLPEPEYFYPDVLSFCLQLPRGEMDSRISARVDWMWEQGFVAEVRGLLERGLRDGLTASRALGYRQIISHLDGAYSEAEARENTITGTRRFARKQLAWFRRDPRMVFLDANSAPAS
ncbi:MAG: tRNA (adenosine(37)-N6)-dimethylallyltransferase MiaA, partial [Propionibacteriaceae bacterium]|nr:tRNA (adenosine(37)-N6)-dimethylallyltransferase MiaA [Propionibacteriaceae bacterium]